MRRKTLNSNQLYSVSKDDYCYAKQLLSMDLPNPSTMTQMIHKVNALFTQPLCFDLNEVQCQFFI